MQSLTPQLTKELASHIGKQPVSKAAAFAIDNYRSLVEHVARLAYVNRNHLLFFRGQNKGEKGGQSLQGEKEKKGVRAYYRHCSGLIARTWKSSRAVARLCQATA